MQGVRAEFAVFCNFYMTENVHEFHCYVERLKVRDTWCVYCIIWMSVHTYYGLHIVKKGNLL